MARFIVWIAPDWSEMLVADLLCESMGRRAIRRDVGKDDPHEVAHIGSALVVGDSAYCHTAGECRLEHFQLRHTNDGRAMLMPTGLFDSEDDSNAVGTGAASGVPL